MYASWRRNDEWHCSMFRYVNPWWKIKLKLKKNKQHTVRQACRNIWHIGWGFVVWGFWRTEGGFYHTGLCRRWVLSQWVGCTHPGLHLSCCCSRILRRILFIVMSPLGFRLEECRNSFYCSYSVPFLWINSRFHFLPMPLFSIRMPIPIDVWRNENRKCIRTTNACIKQNITTFN